MISCCASWNVFPVRSMLSTIASSPSSSPSSPVAALGATDVRLSGCSGTRAGGAILIFVLDSRRSRTVSLPAFRTPFWMVILTAGIGVGKEEYFGFSLYSGLLTFMKLKTNFRTLSASSKISLLGSLKSLAFWTKRFKSLSRVVTVGYSLRCSFASMVSRARGSLMIS